VDPEDDECTIAPGLVRNAQMLQFPSLGVSALGAGQEFEFFGGEVH